MAKKENRTILVDADGLEIVVPEQGTLKMTATLRDEAGAPILLTSVATLTLTLYARDDGAKTIVNAIDHANIKNAGRGTLHATSGLVTISLDGADHSIVNSTNDQEWHRALIEAAYSSNPTHYLKSEIDFPVRNLARVA